MIHEATIPAGVRKVKTRGLHTAEQVGSLLRLEQVWNGESFVLSPTPISACFWYFCYEGEASIVRIMFYEDLEGHNVVKGKHRNAALRFILDLNEALTARMRNRLI